LLILSGKIPIIKSREVIQVLGEFGFFQYRQKGSHAVYKNLASGRSTTVPINGNHDVPGGTLASIIRQTGITPAEFVRALK
jgi:predicted RNA binding protein YcfA (HicA-like mRNA interferase family)